MECIPDGSRVFSDCMNVVTAYKMVWSRLLKDSFLHASLWKGIIWQREVKPEVTVEHVYAHQAACDVACQPVHKRMVAEANNL
eukprot:11762290-Prorocentrum_lima.AAC.1